MTTNTNNLMMRDRLGAIFVRSGKVTQAQLEEALEVQRTTAQRLGDILVDRGLLSRRDILEARAQQLDVPFFDVTGIEVDTKTLTLVPRDVALRYKLLPLEVVGNRLRVAMASPNDVEPLDLLQRTTPFYPEPFLADEATLQEAIERLYGSLAMTPDADSLDSVIGEIEIERVEDDAPNLDDMIQASEQAPVVKMVNLLLTEAIRARASDIHLEPGRDSVEVRHRVDGTLRKARVFPKSLQAACTSRLKIMAELDISEKRLPQDGRIPLIVEGRSLDLRVSTLPNLYGERVVMRVLDKGNLIRSLDSLDLSQHNIERFQRLIRRPFGIILVTGPTGSGKTTTLYSALNALHDGATNIMTCEDPVEYEMAGISQSPTHDRIGLTFARQLRAILRQDPDVILVGEIRDQETAEIAFRAAITGHLVLSTLHANDAPSAVTRLLDMGVPPFLISSALIGIVAQRLMRRLCPECRTPDKPTPAETATLGLQPTEIILRPVGCPRCEQEGFKGRIATHELMTCDEQFSRAIMAQAPASKLQSVAVAAGMLPMRDDAVEKVRAGITTPSEVLRRCVMIEATSAGGAVDAAAGE